jgi:hypothetical protein
MSQMRAFHWTILSIGILVMLRAEPVYSSDFLPWIKTLAIDPQTPTTLYAGTSGGGVFKSTNGGASWNQTGLTNVSVLSLAIDPQTPATLYAGTYESSVFKSIDGGATWFKTIDGSATCPTTGLTDVGLITSLAIDPVVPATLYAALNCYSVNDWGEWTNTGGAVNKSTDGGNTWSFSSLSAGVLALAIDPVAPATIYAGTEQIPYGTEQIPGFYIDETLWGDVFVSTDGGASWVPLNIYAGSILALAVAPGTPSTGYAGTSSGLVVSFSTEGCCGFVLLNDGAWAIAIDPQTPTTLYAAGGTGVRKSTDGGATWTATGLDFTGVLTLGIEPTDLNTIYAGTHDGVYKSTNGGGDWSLTGLINWTHVSSVSVNPSGVTGGSPSTGTVTLTTPAPDGGITVALFSSNTAVATVPATVTVPAGATSVEFTVTSSSVNCKCYD